MSRWLRLVLVAEWFYRGLWDGALELADVEIAESESGTPHYLESDLRLMRGRIRLARGDRAGALEDAERSLDRAREAKDPQILFPAIAFAAEALLATGDELRAGALADELLGELVGEATGMWSFVTLAWVLLDLGRERELLPVLAEQNPGRWVDASVAVARGDLAEAADIFARIGSRPDEAQARMTAACRLVREGRAALARPQLEDALAFFKEVEATAYLRRAELLLPASA
jgi:tetratricopeptide (TPR) repeat protein